MAAYTTIDDPSLYLRIKLYAGNATNDTAITWDETDTNMQPNLLWFKSRTDTQSHALWDSVRGALKRLIPNSTGAEGDEATNLDSFDSNGFTVDNEAIVNGTSRDYVCWGWKESTTAGFDIVSYTGTGSNQTISHGLSAALDFIIVKNLATTNQWCIYNRPRSAEKFIHLDVTDAESDAATVWQDTEPTSSVFSVGTSALTNGDGNAMIAYCFAPIQGFSKFGSYTGNGDADGAYVHLGFRPAWIVVKRTDSANSWMMYDNKRNPINLVDNPLYAEGNDAEGTSSAASFDFLSNGFKCRGTGSAINASGATMIYMAFAESPFVNSNGVPNNAR